MNVYVYVQKGVPVHRTDSLSDSINVDYSEDSELIGIEVIAAAAFTAESNE